MHYRVVRFTDVDLERADALTAEIQSNDAPPPGIKSTGIQMIIDRDQHTAVVVQIFDSEQDMRDSEQGFDSMDPGQTPGTRSSIDRGEVVLDLKMESATS